jgi:hypothetical protein
VSGKAGGGMPNRPISVTIDGQTPDNQLTGAIQAEGLGSFAFTGVLLRNEMVLVFHDAGASAGFIDARLAKDDSLLVGRFVDQTAGQKISGNFRATPGGAAASAAGVPTLVGASSAASTFQQQNLIGPYSGPAHLMAPRAFQVGVSPVPITLSIGTESDAGLVTGTLGLLNQAFTLSGVVDGSHLDFVLSGPGAGEGMATIGASAISLRGSLVLTLSAGTVRGTFALTNPVALQKVRPGTGGAGTAFNGPAIPGQPGSLPTPVTGFPTLGTGTGGTGTGSTGLGGSGGFIPGGPTPGPGMGPITLGP